MWLKSFAPPLPETDGRKEEQILEEARAAYAKAKRLRPSPQTQKSGMWAAPNKAALWEKGRRLSLTEAIRSGQESRLIAFSHPVESKAFGLACEDLLRFLSSQGFSLQDAPAQIEESSFLGPPTTLLWQGRRLSTNFLCRVAMTLRVRDWIPQQGGTIFEIGGGLGNLARVMKLFHPWVRYVILDLPETLFFSYLFLRGNFPEARAVFVVSKEDFDRIEGADFVFIPSDLVAEVPPLVVDLVVNTHSLGEMRQETVECYLELIQHRLQVSFLYSLNRFLQSDRLVGARDGDYQALCSLPLDPYWKTLLWNYPPDFVRWNRTPGDMEETLEVLAQRLPESQRLPEEARRMGREYRQRAVQVEPIRSSEWIQWMWEAVRLDPSPENIRPYHQFLSESGCREYRYYQRLLTLQESFATAGGSNGAVGI